MRFAQIRKMDISNGEGIGVALFTQGCSIKCDECFNPETGDFEGGYPFIWGEHDREILKLLNKPYINRFSILGGEPFSEQNLPVLNELIRSVKYHMPHIKIWIWSGYTYEKLSNNDYINSILNKIDYLIAGPFIQEEKDLTLQGRGSRNQEVIDMRQTIEQGEKILYVQ